MTYYRDNELYHHGVKGQRWGVIRNKISSHKSGIRIKGPSLAELKPTNGRKNRPVTVKGPSLTELKTKNNSVDDNSKTTRKSKKKAKQNIETADAIDHLQDQGYVVKPQKLVTRKQKAEAFLKKTGPVVIAAVTSSALMASGMGYAAPLATAAATTLTTAQKIKEQ